MTYCYKHVAPPELKTINAVLLQTCRSSGAKNNKDYSYKHVAPTELKTINDVLLQTCRSYGALFQTNDQTIVWKLFLFNVDNLSSPYKIIIRNDFTESLYNIGRSRGAPYIIQGLRTCTQSHLKCLWSPYFFIVRNLF